MDNRINTIDDLLIKRAQDIAQDPDATTASLEWARKFMNDYYTRNGSVEYSERDAVADLRQLYGDVKFDLPLNVKGVNLCEEQ